MTGKRIAGARVTVGSVTYCVRVARQVDLLAWWGLSASIRNAIS